MKGKLVGWVVSALFIVVVVAIAMRVSFIRNLIVPQQAAAA